MISILHRHIVKTILLATSVVAAVVIGLIFFINLLGELNNLGVGDYHIGQAISYVILRLPHELYQFFPMLVLLGGLSGLSILSAQQELMIMRASGFSIAQITKAVFIAAVVLILVVTFVGEWIAPASSYLAAIRKENAKNGGQAVITGSGVWIHEGNTFLHIDQVVDRNRLDGVTGYQFDENHHLKTAYYAQRLDLHDGQWTMYNLVKTTFMPERIVSKEIPQAPWNIKLNSNVLNIGLIEPSEMSLGRLNRFTRYLVQNGLQAAPYQFEFWARIFQPLTSVVMIFLAIPFVLGMRGRATMGWRLVCGVLISFVFYILNAFLGQASVVFQLPPWFAASFPSLLFGLLSLFLLRSAR